MHTDCTPTQLGFEGLGRRAVTGRFDGGRLSSDGGGVLLREVDLRLGLMARLGGCFTDYRTPASVEHGVRALVAQRIYGLALGYEDLNDHGALRQDALLALLVGTSDPTGSQRVRARDRGAALASASTLNRLELGRPEAAPASRYHRIVADPQALDALLVDLFVEAHAAPPAELWLDLDATDDPLHGQQEGRFFHGYYRHYCYLPLYIFCDEHLLGARLRPANQDAAAGSVAELERIVAHLRRRWPATRIGIRGDGGFCREAILAWCERHGVADVLGLARNARLAAALEPALQEAAAEHRATGQPARRFRDLQYRTLTSWSRTRRVVGKAEVLARGRNPRFVVTSLTPDEADARELYEDRYCIRGSMENRIKEQQLDLFADRTSAHTMRANQLRLYFSSFAYVLLHGLRRLGTAGTDLARAQCGTLRRRLLKIGTRIRITARRVWLAFSEAYPGADTFARVLANLQRQPTWRPPRASA